MPQVIHDAGEEPLVLHSKLQGTIAQMPFLHRALLFAELSMISYNDEAEAQKAAAAIGFPDCTLFDNDGSQAFRFRNATDCVIACRGTEAHEWNDIQADVNVGTVLSETVGKVHRGFKREVDDLWPMLEQVLEPNRLPLWFSGHSLGGAMATICAGRCLRSYINSNPQELFTFGSPRVGDRTYVSNTKYPHFRFVNNNDIVTQVPPTLLGYYHTGREVYFNRTDRIQELRGWRKFVDRIRGMLAGFGVGKIDAFGDHKIHRYIECILNELQFKSSGDSEAIAA